MCPSPMLSALSINTNKMARCAECFRLNMDKGMTRKTASPLSRISRGEKVLVLDFEPQLVATRSRVFLCETHARELLDRLQVLMSEIVG